MDKTKVQRWMGVLAIVVISSLLAATASAAGRPGSLEAAAVKAVAAQEGLRGRDLMVVNSAVATYPLTGQNARDFKVMDRQTGMIYGVSLNAEGGILDGAQLQANEQATFNALYGHLEPALVEQLAATAAEEAVPVIIWLKEPAYTGPVRPDANGGAAMTESQMDTFLAQVDGQRAAAVARVTMPAAQRLASLGYDLEAAVYSPALYATLRQETILEVANWSEVDRIYLDRTNEPDLEIARATIYADVVNSLGYTGTGVKVAQIEVGGRIATANPYLSGVTQDTTYVCATASSHSTGVAGIIRSTHSTRKGIAYGVSLWAGGSCSGSSSQLQNRSTAAADWGARALNLSWGSDTNRVLSADDRFYDDLTINRYRVVVKSAGNRGAAGCSGSDGDITSPGLAYNVITVGNFDDKNSTTWTGDTMSSCSSWNDPISTHNDREKPEVSAPGTTINSTTTVSPWTGAIGSGTSFAAPMVTGVTALLMQRNTSLQSWPEAVKAILMTTAGHNIEGVARLSDKDGAGAVIADYADAVANTSSITDGNWGGQSYTCATVTPLDVTTMSLTANVRMRATIAWDTDDDYSNYNNEPSADLDLQIVNSSNTVVASSTSWENSYEIVDYTPTVGGTYTLRVVRYRCSDSPDWLGWAWRSGTWR